MPFNKDLSLEDRVTALEAENVKLTGHLKTAVVLLAGNNSNPWASPLNRFFEIADGGGLFVDDPVLDEFDCIIGCVEVLEQMLKAAGNDQAAKDAAYAAHSVCFNKCSGLPT